MKLENRTREWIHKPVFNGVPVSWARKYCEGRFKRFREEHKEFDEFLNEVNNLLQKEKHTDYNNIHQFLSGVIETNWITPRHTLFDILIKLFNLCLSPNQAYEYIKECHERYLIMANSEYEIWDKPKIYIEQTTNYKSIEVDVKPKNGPDGRFDYWFRISTSLRVIEDPFNDVSCHANTIELVSKIDICEDALMLFEYHQNKPLLRNVFNTAISESESGGFIKEVKSEPFYSWIIHYYE